MYTCVCVYIYIYIYIYLLHPCARTARKARASCLTRPRKRRRESSPPLIVDRVACFRLEDALVPAWPERPLISATHSVAVICGKTHIKPSLKPMRPRPIASYVNVIVCTDGHGMHVHVMTRRVVASSDAGAGALSGTCANFEAGACGLVESGYT